MTNLKNHLNADASLMTLFTNRFSRHPERYIEIFGILRKRPPHNMLYVDGQSVVANPLAIFAAISYTHS